MTDPAWGVRVFGFAGCAVIAVPLGLDQAPRLPDAGHLTTIALYLLSALVCARLPQETSRRLAAVALPASPVPGCTSGSPRSARCTAAAGTPRCPSR